MRKLHLSWLQAIKSTTQYITKQVATIWKQKRQRTSGVTQTKRNAVAMGMAHARCCVCVRARAHKRNAVHRWNRKKPYFHFQYVLCLPFYYNYSCLLSLLVTNWNPQQQTRINERTNEQTKLHHFAWWKKKSLFKGNKSNKIVNFYCGFNGPFFQ